MIFYFTATGNSLYVAKQLEEERISIAQAIHQENQEYKAPAIGVICPIYGSEPPQIVQDFLKTARFDTEYFYIIMTYGRHSRAATEVILKLAREQGIRVDYIRTIKMVDNYLPGFDMLEERKEEKQVEKQLAVIREELGKRIHFWEAVNEEERKAYEKLLISRKEHPERSWKRITFYAEDNCVGCGLCTRVCPAGCIQLEGKKAVHTGINCQVCMACVHHCPKKAIRLSVAEVNPKARYRNEHIRVDEIIKANEQVSKEK